MAYPSHHYEETDSAHRPTQQTGLSAARRAQRDHWRWPLFVSALGNPTSTLSEHTLNRALRGIGYGHDDLVGHGFRSMASTLLNEHGWTPDTIERQLAHIEENETRRAYNYAEYLAERRLMMQGW